MGGSFGPKLPYKETYTLPSFLEDILKGLVISRIYGSGISLYIQEAMTRLNQSGTRPEVFISSAKEKLLRSW